jgi:hypothetical protein
MSIVIKTSTRRFKEERCLILERVPFLSRECARSDFCYAISHYMLTTKPKRIYIYVCVCVCEYSPSLFCSLNRITFGTQYPIEVRAGAPSDVDIVATIVRILA